MPIKRTHPKQRTEIGKYMVRDPEIYYGELTFKGTRLPVDIVSTYVIKGMPLYDVQKN
jgi:uncharacterized protein (DUF433 family)